MRIIAYSTLRDFWERPGRRDAEQPLRAWFFIAEKADWAGPADIKRLVVYPNYQWRTVYIRFVGSHADYDQINVETV